MPNKPFFRKFDQWWYVEVGPRGHRKQIKLVKGKQNKKEAFRLFCEMMAHDQLPHSPSQILVAQVFDLFLDWSNHNHSPETYKWYLDFLQNFSDKFGSVKVIELKPYHINLWIRDHGWNSTSQNGAIGCVKRALNWAVENGIIPESPIRSMRKPRQLRRERFVTAEERKLILSNIKDKEFKLFLFALGNTGARPKEVRTVTADHVDFALGIWRFDEHKSVHQTGKPKIIYLTPPLLKLCRMLVTQHPEGPIFRNTRGKAWTRNAIRCRFRRLREKLNLAPGLVSYSYRHGYVTEALIRGVPIAAVAELVGHSSTAMIAKHYSHLAEKTEFLRQAAVEATKPT